MEDQESQQTCKNWQEKRERASGGEEKGVAGAQKVGSQADSQKKKEENNIWRRVKDGRGWTRDTMIVVLKLTDKIN